LGSEWGFAFICDLLPAKSPTRPLLLEVRPITVKDDFGKLHRFRYDKYNLERYTMQMKQTLEMYVESDMLILASAPTPTTSSATTSATSTRVA